MPHSPITEFQGEYRFLSNFQPVLVTATLNTEWYAFHSAEHMFQAVKTLDKTERQTMADMPTPGDAKKYGRRVTLRPDWEDVKLATMAHVTEMKYQDPKLAEKLLATGDAELIEGNAWCDTFWGVCHCDKHVNADGTGTGLNWLGRIIMIERSKLRLKRSW